MPEKGFDANFSLAPIAACLVREGYTFVVRYYNVNTPSKNLTPVEARDLVRAGLRLVAVWENGYPNHAGYFNHATGVHDGAVAYHYGSQTIGQPFDCPIYFAADYDASEADIDGPVTAYFRGIADVFALISSRTPGQPVYRVGVYGSGLTCSKLLAAGLVTYTWLSQSTGFRGSRTFHDYNLKQLAEKIVCEKKGDPDETNPPRDPGTFVVAVPAEG